MEQEMKWKKIMKSCMDNVKMHFADIDKSIDFGAYPSARKLFCILYFSHKRKIKSCTTKRTY